VTPTRFLDGVERTRQRRRADFAFNLSIVSVIFSAFALLVVLWR
jgi:hypothetical protein